MLKKALLDKDTRVKRRLGSSVMEKPNNKAGLQVNRSMTDMRLEDSTDQAPPRPQKRFDLAYRSPPRNHQSTATEKYYLQIISTMKQEMESLLQVIKSKDQDVERLRDDKMELKAANNQLRSMLAGKAGTRYDGMRDTLVNSHQDSSPDLSFGEMKKGSQTVLHHKGKPRCV